MKINQARFKIQIRESLCNKMKNMANKLKLMVSIDVILFLFSHNNIANIIKQLIASHFKECPSG